MNKQLASRNLTIQCSTQKVIQWDMYCQPTYDGDCTDVGFTVSNLGEAPRVFRSFDVVRVQYSSSVRDTVTEGSYRRKSSTGRAIVLVVFHARPRTLNGGNRMARLTEFVRRMDSRILEETSLVWVACLIRSLGKSGDWRLTRCRTRHKRVICGTYWEFSSVHRCVYQISWQQQHCTVRT